MKIFSALCIVIIVMLSFSCGSGNNTNKKYTGTIEAAGITSYQYGTHRLITSTETYALQSDSIVLKDYEGQEVTITAEKIEGYPIDGGPLFLKVLRIQD